MKRLVYGFGGYVAGLATGWYVQRRLRRTVERVAPEHVRVEVAQRGRQAVGYSRQAADRARDLASDLRDAASEGVATMRREEADLLAEFAADEVMHTGPARRLAGREGAARPRGYRPRH